MLITTETAGAATAAGVGALNWWPLNLVGTYDSSSNWSLIATGGTVLATVVGSIFFVMGNQRRKESNQLHQQMSIHIGDGVYKSALLKDDKHVMTSYFPEVTTLYHAFLRGMQVSENGKCTGQRIGDKYEFLNYAEVFQKSHELGSAFITHLGVQPGNFTNVAIYSRNQQEWLITAIACLRFSIVVVPLYDTLGPDAAIYILKHTDTQYTILWYYGVIYNQFLGVVIVDDYTKAKKLLEMVNQVKALRHIVVVDTISDVQLSELQDASEQVNVHRFNELLNVGAKSIQPDVPPKPDDTYIICYTSGTTGTPKGVMLSHANVIANASAVIAIFKNFLPDVIKPKNSMISYLPLSHMFEQVAHWSLLMFGGTIGYFSGSVNELSDDMKALKPTILPIVPRLLNRFNDTIKVQLSRSNIFKRTLFNLAYSSKLAQIKKGIFTNDTLWDKIVFKKPRDELGGNVKVIITGSAPISAEVLENCRVIFGSQICEGYGQTECTALATFTFPDDVTGDHCGGPGVCSLIKLEDVPDLNYYSKDNKGEILIKGPSVTKGYYKDEAKTAELFDEQGFIHTGDIGYILPNGAFKIIDRKKHIFKLAQGEYVAPEKIENVYIHSLHVQQIFVDGDSLKRYLVAIAVPLPKQVIQIYADLHSVNENSIDLETACKDEKVIKFVLKDMQKIGKANKLNSIEQVKALYLEPHPFTVENGLLTPTLKSKRPQLRKKYEDIIKELYKNT